MVGSTLRRLVPIAAIILFLLPLASASAKPVQRSETSFAIRLADWSHTLLAPVEALLQQLRPILEADYMPPGQKPGNDPNPQPGNREGSGTDPHGRP